MGDYFHKLMRLKVFGKPKIILLLLGALLIFFPGAGVSDTSLAGKISVNSQYMEVQLVGATQFGVVQIFGHLLTKLESVKEVVPIEMQIITDTPQRCFAKWKLHVIEGENFEVVSQLIAIIKELDPDKENEVLYEWPFTVVRDDLILLTRTESVSIGPRDALFSIGSGMGDTDTVQPTYHFTSENRWFALPGVGFD